MSSNGRLLAYGRREITHEKGINVFDIDAFNTSRSSENTYDQNVESSKRRLNLAWSTDSKTLAVLYDDGLLHIINVRKRSLISSIFLQYTDVPPGVFRSGDIKIFLTMHNSVIITESSANVKPSENEADAESETISLSKMTNWIVEIRSQSDFTIRHSSPKCEYFKPSMSPDSTCILGGSSNGLNEMARVRLLDAENGNSVFTFHSQRLAYGGKGHWFDSTGKKVFIWNEYREDGTKGDLQLDVWETL